MIKLACQKIILCIQFILYLFSSHNSEVDRKWDSTLLNSKLQLLDKNLDNARLISSDWCCIDKGWQHKPMLEYSNPSPGIRGVFYFGLCGKIIHLYLCFKVGVSRHECLTLPSLYKEGYNRAILQLKK